MKPTNGDLRSCRKPANVSQMTLEEIQSEVEGLSEADRSELLLMLVDRLPMPAHSVTDHEVARRRAEIESGEVQDISFDELRARLDLAN